MKWVSKSQDNIFSIYILYIKHRDVDTISDKYNIKIHRNIPCPNPQAGDVIIAF